MGIGRSIGLGYTYYTDKFYGSTGLFAGSVDNHNKGDQGFSTTTKLVYTPIVNDKVLFQVGGSFTYRTPEANGFSESLNDDDYNREVMLSAGPEHKFLNAEIAHAGNELKLNMEILATYGRFMFQSEYYSNKVYRKSNYDLQFKHSRPDMWGWSSTEKGFEDWYGVQRDIETDGYYVQAGFLLKGDDYSYNSASAYINRPKAGSLELVARFNKTNMNDIDGIFMQNKFWDADPSKAASGQTNFSVGGGESVDWALGLNYYVSNNVMFRLNYTSMDIDNVYYRQDDKVSFVKARVQVNF
jgi:phosphate-selective porin OprO/OprP